MARDPKIDLLHSIPLFSQAGTRDLERIAQLTDEVDLPAGHILMRQGDQGREMFILATGGADIVRDGRTIKAIGPGAVVGEIALLSEGPRTATVRLTEPSRLFVLGHREFHSLMDESTALRDCVYNELGRRLRTHEADQAH